MKVYFLAIYGKGLLMEFKLNDYHRNVPDAELIRDLQRVSTELGKSAITIEEYKERGKYSRDIISRRFGGWIEALKKSGLSPSVNQVNIKGVGLKDMLKDLEIVSKKLGKQTFTSNEYSKYGKYSRNIFFRKFGSWNEALKAAGLVPFDHPLGGGEKNKVSKYACLDEIERLWIELGRQPTTIDIKNGRSKFSLHTYERRFGSWRKALEFFVDYINEEKDTDSQNVSNDEQTRTTEIHAKDESSFEHRTKRDINLRLRFMVMKRDDFKCRLCGRSPATTPGLILHIDHILPWSKGGETVMDNLQTLCSDCNLGKSDLA